MNKIIAEISAANPARHTLRFWWLGQQSWVVKTCAHTVYIDPYLTPKEKRNTTPFFTPQEMINADLILGTHDHSDHIDRPLIGAMAAASPQARIIVPLLAAQTLPENGVPAGRIRPLDHEQVYAEEGLRITALKAKHEFFDRSRQTGYPYLQYIIQSGGMTIYAAGDTLLYDGMLTRLQDFAPDLAFVPINGRDAPRYRRGCMGNMTWQEAADLCGELRPALACPAHYEMFSDNAQDPKPFVEYCGVKYPELALWLGQPGEGRELTKRSATGSPDNA